MKVGSPIIGWLWSLVLVSTVDYEVCFSYHRLTMKFGSYVITGLWSLVLISTVDYEVWFSYQWLTMKFSSHMNGLLWSLVLIPSLNYEFLFSYQRLTVKFALISMDDYIVWFSCNRWTMKFGSYMIDLLYFWTTISDDCDVCAFCCTLSLGMVSRRPCTSICWGIQWTEWCHNTTSTDRSTLSTCETAWVRQTCIR